MFSYDNESTTDLVQWCSCRLRRLFLDFFFFFFCKLICEGKFFSPPPTIVQNLFSKSPVVKLYIATSVFVLVCTYTSYVRKEWVNMKNFFLSRLKRTNGKKKAYQAVGKEKKKQFKP